MAKQVVRKTSQSDTDALGDKAQEAFAKILDELNKIKEAPKLFASGIELIKLTVKVGSNIEFSVVVAGKDAPKVEELASISE